MLMVLGIWDCDILRCVNAWSLVWLLITDGFAPAVELFQNIQLIFKMFIRGNSIDRCQVGCAWLVQA